VGVANFQVPPWVAGLAAAALSVRGLATALVFLRGVLIRTGTGALIVGVGELVYGLGDLSKAQILLTYQSRTNRKEWIGPDTEKTLVHLVRKCVKNVSLGAPGFTADCIETLEELGMRATKCFVDAGGGNITLVPCLNDSDVGNACNRKQHAEGRVKQSLCRSL
jgi:hypothetical protein